MKKILNINPMRYVLMISIIFQIISCSDVNNEPSQDGLQKGHDITKKYCTQCHSPSGGLTSLPLSRMAKEYKEKELEEYLLDEFQSIETRMDHMNLDYYLSKSDINNLIAYLKTLP